MEGQILRAVVRRGIAPSAVSAKIEVASRTDRGVSAVGNALTLTSALPPNALLRVLNGVEPDIDFTAARAVPESFRVRAAIRRVYRYFPGRRAPMTSSKWTDVARHFSGSVDVRSFGRALPAGSPVWRTIESVTVTSRPGGTVVELRAPSFVWGMVRKIVAALREVEAGRVSVDRLDAALQGWTRLTLPMAESEPLRPLERRVRPPVGILLGRAKSAPARLGEVEPGKSLVTPRDPRPLHVADIAREEVTHRSGLGLS